jgi:ribosome-associated toxin RatA of RatAB toxin-antitoxin module
VAAIVHSVEISRPPGDVFAFVTDVPRFTDWQEGLVSARRDGDGPMTVGSRAAMTRRIGGRERTVTTQVTEHNPPRDYAFRGIDGPIRPSGKGTVEPVGDGTRSRVTFELDFEGHGLGKLLLPIVRRRARRDLPKSHQNLKRQLERGAA